MPSAIDFLNAPDGAPPITAAPQSALDFLNAPDAPENPHTLGQTAAQTAGASPVAAPPPVVPATMLQNANANRGISPQMASAPQQYGPSIGPNADEPNFDPAQVSVNAAQHQAGYDPGAVHTPQDNAAYASMIDAARRAIMQPNVDAVKKELGANFDPAHGYDYAFGRAKMGTMGNTADRAAYLAEHLPKGSDIKTINVPGLGPMTVFKLPGSDTYQPIRGVQDSSGAVGDQLSSTGQMAAAVGMAALTKDWGLLSRMTAQGVGGAAERAAELKANDFGGYDSQSGWSDAGSAAKSGAVNATSEIFASALANALGKGGGIFDPAGIPEERLAAQKALQNYAPDLRGLTAFQMGHPLLASKGARLAAVNPTMGNIVRDQRGGLSDLFTKSMNDATGGAPVGLPSSSGGALNYPGIDAIVAKMQGDAAAPLAGIPEVSPKEGGMALANIYQNAIKPVVERTNTKYGNVLETMGNAPQYENGVVPIDLSGTQSTIQREAAPIYLQGKPQTIETPQMSDIGGGQIQTGTTTSVSPTDVRSGGGIKPGIAHPVSVLSEANPQLGVGPMTDRTPSPYEGLLPVRSQLSETSQFNPMALGADRATSVQAGRILAPLDQAIEAAAGPAGTAAKNSRVFQSKILDNPNAIAARETAYPESNMTFADPKNATFLANTQRLASATGQGDTYKIFQNAYATAFKKDPSLIDSAFKGGLTDQNAFQRLLPKETQDLVSTYRDNIANVEKSLPMKLSKISDFGERARTAVETSTPEQLQELVTQAGGQDSPIGQGLRGGMFRSILEKSMDKSGENAGKFNATRAISAISDAIGTDTSPGVAHAVLNPAELQRLKDIRTMAGGVDSLQNSMGSSLYGSDLAGKATNVLRPVQLLKAIGDLTEARVQNWAWTGDKMQGTLFGKPGGNTGLEFRVPALAVGAHTSQKSQFLNPGQEPQY